MSATAHTEIRGQLRELALTSTTWVPGIKLRSAVSLQQAPLQVKSLARKLSADQMSWFVFMSTWLRLGTREHQLRNRLCEAAL